MAGVFGTKCGFDNGELYTPETLGAIYSEMIQEWGIVHKPVPGAIYIKRKEPLGAVDRPAFRAMPFRIKILSPARLYRSDAWYYKSFHKKCECFWSFDYEFTSKITVLSIQSTKPVRILTTCYLPSKETSIQSPKQLILEI